MKMCVGFLKSIVDGSRVMLGVAEREIASRSTSATKMLGGTLARLRGRPRFAQSAMCSNGLSTVADATTTALWIAVAAYGGQILLSDKFGRGWLDASLLISS